MVTSKALFATTVASFLSILSGCGPSVVAPPKAPDPVMPSSIDLPARDPAPGKTRVVLDAAEGQRAAVSEVTPSGVPGVESEKRLCVAPCVAELHQGVHVFRFADEHDPTRQGTARVELGEKPKLVRHAMGRTKTHTGVAVAGIVLASLGGGALGVAGAMVDTDDGRRLPTKDEMTIGWVSLGVGAALSVIGISMLFASFPSIQPGATTEKTISR